ncbi:glycosyltransferase [Pseudothermotoga lettingae]|uniref:Glycosyl transferase group 1 n=1 Tax=Pseudothermotoga lettingae (strain ATCC BAA-301 / DSM 14385 / NBRC 107922 / TMO) TaxID=416591 RepID=A8F6F7_PSELT|nr:glycosyltransferase [Pseudothermotoga lettingae]ABV33741.1 glycosyl transferase group 1 [Pseudothermotoga lettingae TMO]GLI49341.1 glycosyl transferase family 1 [Pseudothermotoga lettingae TMO]
MNRQKSSRRNSEEIILIGVLPFVIDKYGYLARGYLDHGLKVKILTYDLYGTAGEIATKYGVEIIKVPRNPFLRLFYSISKILEIKPRYFEIYDYSVLTFFYVIVSKILHTHVTMPLIGYEIFDDDPTAKAVGISRLRIWIKKKLTKLAIRFSDLIWVKEYQTFEALKKKKGIETKLFFFSNSIPLPDKISEFKTRTLDILWLNRIRERRFTTDLIKALEVAEKDLLGIKPYWTVAIVGFFLDDPSKSLDPVYEDIVLKAIQEHNNKWNIKIRAENFTKDPAKYISNAKVFVLLSDVIFANYALLEAMANGVIPIVNDGVGAEKIINHGENGFIVPTNDIITLAKTLVDIFVMMEKYPQKARSISDAARRTINEKFSINSFVRQIMSARKK